MNFMRKIVSFGLLVVSAMFFMAAVPFSKCGVKKNYAKIERLTNNDSVYFVPHEIKKTDVVDLLKRETLYNITETFAPLHYADAVFLDSVVLSTLASKPLECTKTWRYKTIDALYYSPDVYVEGFVKTSKGLSPRYCLYIDTKSRKAHITLLKNDKVYTSDVYSQQDSVNIDAVIEIFKNYSIKSDMKETKQEDVLFPPSPDKNSSTYLKDKTSEYIFNAIKNWELSSVMLIDPMGNKGKLMHGFTIFESCDRISTENSKRIKDILVASSSYKQSDVVKNSTFLPDYACRFSKDGEYVDVLVALYCDDIKIYHKDKEYTLDISPSHKAFANYIQTIFPNDKYIKKY